MSIMKEIGFYIVKSTKHGYLPIQQPRQAPYANNTE